MNREKANCIMIKFRGNAKVNGRTYMCALKFESNAMMNRVYADT